MRYRNLGRSGLIVSELCLGTMTFGGGEGMWRVVGQLQQDDADALVKASLKELIEGHYLRTTDGKSGRTDPAKWQAVGDFAFANGILLDGQGLPLKKKPDFSTFYTNSFLG